MIRRLAVVLILLAVAACAGFKAVGPARESVGRFSVAPDIQWNSHADSSRDVWTVNGLALDRVIFFSGVEDGEKLYDTEGADPLPEYRAGSDAFAVAQLVAATMRKDGFEQVSTGDLAPVRFGGRDGFSFALTMLTKAGLRLRGLVAGSNADGVLDMMIYIAPATHYYDHLLPSVRRMVRSVQYAG